MLKLLGNVSSVNSISVSSGTNKQVQRSFLFLIYAFILGKCATNVEHILLNTFVKFYRNCLADQKENC